MKLFLDSANINEVEECLKRGFLGGITTNPSLLSKEVERDFIEQIKEIARLCCHYKQMVPLSAEVLTPHAKEMVKEALGLVQKIDYENLNIKIPMGWDELEVIYQLSKRGIAVNCTCLFTEGQCVLAANAGARYVSLFMARLKDIGADALPVIERARELLERGASEAEIIVGSIRHQRDILEAQLAGAHIVTAGAKHLQAMCYHPQTEKSVQGFLADFKKSLAGA